MKRRTAVLLLATALLLAGCGAGAANSSPSASSPPTLNNPCALLSRSEVARATGGNVTAVELGASMVTGAQAGCIYKSDGPYGAIVVALSRPGGEAFKSRLQQTLDGPQNVVDLIPGLGDEAYLAGRTDLFVLSGGTVIEISTQLYQPDGSAVLRQLAEIALARL